MNVPNCRMHDDLRRRILISHGAFLRALLGLLIAFGWQAQGASQVNLPSVQFNRFEYDGFQLILKRTGMRSSSQSLSAALRRPDRTVLVVLGDTESLRPIGSRIYTFFKRGGAIFVANDQTDHRFLFDFRTFFNQMETPFSSAETVGDYDDCPFVQDLAPDHQLFQGVKAIATNRPGFLTFRDAEAQSHSIAWLPPNDNGLTESFAVVRQANSGYGRLLVLSDHSVFTNQMLLHASNVTLANNVANWLVEGGRRRRLIFVADGKILPEYSFVNKLPPVPADQLIDAMRDVLPRARPNPFDASFREFANNMIQSMQEADVFNYALRSRTRQRPEAFRRSLIILIATLLGCSVIAKAGISANRDRPRTARRRPRFNDLAPVARVLVREFFEGDYNIDRTQFIPVAVADSWLQRAIQQRRLRRLWRFARSGSSASLSHRRFRRLQRQLDHLKRLREQNRLRIEWRSARASRATG